MPNLDDALLALDDRFARFQAETRIPGVAWGVVAGGALIHGGGAGTIRDGEDCLPDVDAVFRIASMTKGFTASTIMLLVPPARASAGCAWAAPPMATATRQARSNSRASEAARSSRSAWTLTPGR